MTWLLSRCKRAPALFKSAHRSRNRCRPSNVLLTSCASPVTTLAGGPDDLAVTRNERGRLGGGTPAPPPAPLRPGSARRSARATGAGRGGGRRGDRDAGWKRPPRGRVEQPVPGPHHPRWSARASRPSSTGTSSASSRGRTPTTAPRPEPRPRLRSLRFRRPRSTGPSPPTAHTPSAGPRRSAARSRTSATRSPPGIAPPPNVSGASPSATTCVWARSTVYSRGRSTSRSTGLPHALPGPGAADRVVLRAAPDRDGPVDGRAAGVARARGRPACRPTSGRSSESCPRCRSTLSTTPRGRTRSSRTPSAISSAAPTCHGAVPACWQPPLG